jgi:ATP-binding cassette subfamily C protein
MVKYALGLGLIVNLLMLASPLYSMQVLDRVLSSGSHDTLLMLTLVMILALGLLGFIQGGRSFAMHRMGQWFEKSLSNTVFERAIVGPLGTSPSGGGGDLGPSQNLRDLQTLKTYLMSPGLVTVLDTPWALVFIAVLFMLHPAVGGLTVLGALVIIGMGLLSDLKTKSLLKASNDAFAVSMRHADQVGRHGEAIKAMGMVHNVTKGWNSLNETVQTTQDQMMRRQTVFTEMTKFTRLLIQIAVTGLGAYLVLKGEFSSGAIIASSSLVGRALAPFEAAINSWKGFRNCQKAYERLSRCLDTQGLDTVSLETKSLGLETASPQKTLLRNGFLSDKTWLPDPEGKLSVEQVSFSFAAAPAGAPPLLRKINFALQPGELLGIAGPSGSGKTTLAKIILNLLLPTEGEVRLDGAKMQDWPPLQLGSSIGYLPQEVSLFSGPIKANIARLAPEIDVDQVMEAAQWAQVHDLILRLPQGYDTVIGPNGAGLSGGQRQRIALARALYGPVKLLVLDEPYSNLDAQGDAALQQALMTAKEKKVTTLLIAHSPQFLHLADKLLILVGGEVAAFGPRDEVLKAMQQQRQAPSQGVH